MRAARAPSPAIVRARIAAAALCAAALFGACVTHPPQPVPPSPVARPARSLAPTTTRGEFTIAATKLDAWNAVGQIVVRTPGATYAGRSQMLDLYTVRYHDQPFLLVTRALPLSDTIRETTTLVTARTLAGKPIDSDASAELLALLQRGLPAQIDKDRATQAAEAAAKKAKAKTAKPGSHHK